MKNLDLTLALTVHQAIFPLRQFFINSLTDISESILAFKITLLVIKSENVQIKQL